MKSEKGFTLVEMLIVLMIISVLLIITIPNLTQNNDLIRKKGCEALILTAKSQVESFYINNNELPTTIQQLVDEKYLRQTTCPNGEDLTYDATTGEVSEPTSTP